MKILQANINHCRTAHDLLLVSSVDREVDLVLIAEPYKIADDWYTDTTDRAAIWVTNRGMTACGSITCIMRGASFVIVEFKIFYICSIYASPNERIQDFEAFLLKLASVIKPLNSKSKSMIIAGDFNTRSPLWESDVWCNRGKTLFEFCIACDLHPTISKGGNTCVRDRGSKIDIMFCNRFALDCLNDTYVLDEYTASDHNYLIHQLSTPIQLDTLLRPFSLHLQKGKVLDKKFLDLFLAKFANKNFDKLTRTYTTADVDKFISETNKMIRKSTVFPNTFHAKHSPAPWWNDEIARKRKETLNIRRRLTRANKKQDRAAILLLQNEYKICKSKLNIGIKKAKKDCWLKLLQEIDKDVWGRPYKSVVRTIKGKTLPEVLSSSDINAVVNKLFITDCNLHTPVENRETEMTDVLDVMGKPRSLRWI